MTTHSSSVKTTKRTLIEGMKKTARSPQWQDFWTQYEPFIRTVCRSKLRNENDIDDVVSKVMAQVYKQIREYDSSAGRFRAWLKTIASRRAIDEFRRIDRERRRRIDPTSESAHDRLLAKVPDARSGPRTLAKRNEERRLAEQIAVANTKKQVSALQWQIFDCYRLRLWSVAEVRKRLGVKANQVYLARSRVGRIYEKELRAAARKLGAVPAPPPKSKLRPTTKEASARTSRAAARQQ